LAHTHDDHQHERPRDLTRNQDLVLKTLNHAEAPLSAYDILDKLRDDGLRAPLQVYRALEKLIDQGFAHRLESVNAFVCCSQAHGHSGATTTGFAICGKCGRVDEFADEVVADRLTAWAGKHGFKPERTVIELRGVCENCGKVA